MMTSVSQKLFLMKRRNEEKYEFCTRNYHRHQNRDIGSRSILKSNANDNCNNEQPIITECNSDSDSKSESSTSEPRSSAMSNRDKINDFYSRQLSSAGKGGGGTGFLSGTGSKVRKTSLDHVYENTTPQSVIAPDSDGDDEPPVTPSRLEPVQKSRARLLSDGFRQSPKSNAQSILLSNDSRFAEKSSMAAMKAKVESSNGAFTAAASKMMAAKEDHKQQHQQQIQFGDGMGMLKQQSSSSSSKAASASMTVSTSSSTAGSGDNHHLIQSASSSFEQKQQKSHLSQGLIHAGRKSSAHFMSATSSKLNELLQSMSPKMLTFSSEVDMEFDELSSIAKTFKSPIISKTESINMKGSMNKLENKMQNLCKDLVKDRNNLDLLLMMTDMIKKAWSVPQCGYDLGFNMSRIIRETGALEALLCNFETDDDWKVTFTSAQLLEQCLVTENRDYVVEHGLDKVVCIAKECVNKKQPEEVQVGVGILEHLFKHSENTCKEVIKLNGLETILYECRSTDTVTLRHCASALANLSLYGGPDSQESMIKLKAPVWLFPLAFQNDDNIKYYACLAITVLVANKELEAEVIKSGTLDLCEPFVLSHSPEEFAKSSTSHIHGQSKHWLARLVPVLMSKREEARSLAAFHFAMEAWIKKTQEQTEVFREIGAVEALKKVAGCPNAIASKYAAQALRTIGEEVPHKLSQQVPLWTIEDVKEWVKQIGFLPYCQEFDRSRVDGDILLQLTEDLLKDDIGMKNGILRKRFMRELASLKQITDYSSCDPTSLFGVLNSLGQEYARYTYSLLNGGIDKHTLPVVTDEMLLVECNVHNSVHRLRILEAAENLRKMSPVIENKDDDSNKTLDVFISYRRSNGSQLASLLKVHLQLRGFSVFLDVERLEAGKFDNNLLNSIRQAKHFLLVLTANALDRCINDDEHKDWVHREIAQALQCKCNIIPIMESFQWPEVEKLPEDIRPICKFNGIRWIHDYQDACVDKLERFMRGDYGAKAADPVIGTGGSTGHRYGGIPHGLPPTPGGSSASIRSPSQQRRSCSVDNVRGHD